MDISKHTSCQHPNNKYYLEIRNLEDIPSFFIERGAFYICHSNIPALGRLLSKVEKGIANSSLIRLFRYKKSIPNINIVITNDTKLFFIGYDLFRHVKLERLMRKYNFSTEEIQSFFNEFEINRNICTNEIVYMSVRVILMVDIMFKNSDLILFDDVVSPQTLEVVFLRSLQHLKTSPQKTVIIFQFKNSPIRTTFRNMSQIIRRKYEDILDKYDNLNDYIHDMSLE